MENKIESATEIEETRSYLQIASVEHRKRIMTAWHSLESNGCNGSKKQGVRTEIYYLSSSSTTSEEVPPEGLESIAKTLP